MTKVQIRIFTILAAVLLLAAFFLYQKGFFSNAPQAEPTAGATPAKYAPPATPVRAMVVKPQELNDYITVSGSTLPNEEVMISSEVPGKVKDIHFKEGDYIKKGKSLIYLDDEELQAQRNRLQVQTDLNHKIAERFKGLYEKEGVSLQEYEVAQAEYEKSKADLALLDAQLKKRIIRAPFSGRLGLRQVSEGAYLAPGTPIVALVNDNPIKVEFSVPEKYSRSVGKGTPIEFRVENQPGAVQGRVEASDPNIDPDTRTFRLKATAPNPGGKILPGAFANVRVNLQAFDATVMIPTEAIVPELGGKKVYVYRNGTATSVPVQTGIRQESLIQITEGLNNGDTVITTGVLQIRDGTKVEVTEINKQ